METDFTLWPSLGGGMMIGASAVLLMAPNGRISRHTPDLTPKPTEGAAS
jgi:hypothetical protein